MMDSTISYYKKAIEADPNFALAHAQLAYAYAHLAVFLEPTQPAWVAHAKRRSIARRNWIHSLQTLTWRAFSFVQ